MWLNPEELSQLTGFVRPTKQKKALRQMGVRFVERPRDGYPLVEKQQFLSNTPSRQVPNYLPLLKQTKRRKLNAKKEGIQPPSP